MTAAEGPSLPTAFVGDSHLTAADRDSTEAFLAFVASAPRRFARLVLVGDIFDLWLARPHLHEEHHGRVLDALRRAAEEGLPTDYVVGNRDFGVETCPHLPFARVAAETLVAPPATGIATAWVAEHGDLVNVADRQYRAWRALSRSAPVLGAFLRLPASLGVPASQWLERRMRTSNMDAKRRFPTAAAVARAQAHFARTGARYLVLGHFHAELRLPAPPGEVVVLPDWRRARRHAEWRNGPGAGSMTFAGG